MIRRIVLTVLLLGAGLALVDGALVHQLPSAWVPDLLRQTDRYVGGEGAVAGGVLGLGLLLAAVDPPRYRVLVVLAILYGALSVVLLVERYYAGQAGVVPPVVFWVATTALMLACFPTGRRARDDSPAARSLAQRPMPVVPRDRSRGAPN